MTKEKKLLQHNYQTSKDYALLWELLKEQRVACFVDYGASLANYQTRDICITPTLDQDNWTFIGVRGISYIDADGKEDFINQCEEKNLEFIMPNKQDLNCDGCMHTPQTSDNCWHCSRGNKKDRYNDGTKTCRTCRWQYVIGNNLVCGDGEDYSKWEQGE